MSIDPWAADLTLAEISAAQLRNRRRIGRLRAPLFALAGVLASSAVWVLAFGRHRLIVFYAPSLVLAAVVCGWRARRDAATFGVQDKIWPWIATSVVLLVLSASVSRLATLGQYTMVEEIGPAIVFATGVMGFGLWTRTAPVVAGGAAMVTISTISPSITSGDACVAMQLLAYAMVLASVAGRSFRRG